MEHKRIIGFYDYTVILTYLGMIFAFLGIINVLNGEFTQSVICIMFAGVCDMFDGVVASTKDRNQYERHFGIQIDSMCDLISFGVLPALFVYMISEKNIVVGCLTCIYTLCGLIRLAYYNVQEYERQQMTDSKREVFLGLPITSSAVLLPLCYLIYSEASFAGTWIFILMTIILGTGFVSGIEIKKPKLVGKIILILVGLVEIIGVFFLSGADIL